MEVFKLVTKTNNDECDRVLGYVVDEMKEELQSIADDERNRNEIYIHDIVHQNVDDAISSMKRTTQMNLIEETGNESDVDKGLLNTDSLSEFLATMAYGCMEVELYNTDVMQFLQQKLNNEKLSKEDAQEILEELKEYE